MNSAKGITRWWSGTNTSWEQWLTGTPTTNFSRWRCRLLILINRLGWCKTGLLSLLKVVWTRLMRFWRLMLKQCFQPIGWFTRWIWPQLIVLASRSGVDWLIIKRIISWREVFHLKHWIKWIWTLQRIKIYIGNMSGIADDKWEKSTLVLIKSGRRELKSFNV